jgi:hypothetical protein
MRTGDRRRGSKAAEPYETVRDRARVSRPARLNGAFPVSDPSSTDLIGLPDTCRLPQARSAFAGGAATAGPVVYAVGRCGQ